MPFVHSANNLSILGFVILSLHRILLRLLPLIGWLGMVESGPASPQPFQLDHDGGRTPDLFSRGSSPLDSFITDADGYTVIQDKNTSNFVYAMRNDTSGELVSSGIIIGEGDPAIAGITKRLRHSSFEDHTGRHLLEEGRESNHRELAVPSTGTLKNLVILVRFTNHKNRILPTANDFDIVFNHEGNDNENHKLAPTGSVRDVFRVNSYGKLNLNSTVYGWVDLPETEAYYANGVGGFATLQYMEALHSAMDTLRDNDNFNVIFSDFDGDNNGKIDMVTLIHSGYASEANGDDEDGAVGDDRIWSHHRKLPKTRRWYPDPSDKKNDVYVYQYSTAPALYGVKGSSIGRIGVISHEIGHAIGKNLFFCVVGESSFIFIIS